MKLSVDFFSLPALDLARELLGQVLVRRQDGAVAGIIVETEAYTENDPASHSFRGRTRRNKTMFGRPGLGYVYQIYGIHYCFNIVSAREGIGEAVLIRALEPLAGVPLMEMRRGLKARRLLCAGPARLCQALAITTGDDGVDLTGDGIFLLAGKKPREIVTATRIGISKGVDLPYRFYIAGNLYVSRI